MFFVRGNEKKQTTVEWHISYKYVFIYQFFFGRRNVLNNSATYIHLVDIVICTISGRDPRIIQFAIIVLVTMNVHSSCCNSCNIVCPTSLSERQEMYEKNVSIM